MGEAVIESGVKWAVGAESVDSVTLNVNGTEFVFSVGFNLGQVSPAETLIQTLRGRLGLTGSKQSCNEGACGCCTVIADGRAVLSCLMLTVEADGKNIRTIEGLENPLTGELDPLQQVFIDKYAFQCGFCTPGIIMTSRALLDKNPHPSDYEVTDALSGNFCRCISQYHVLEAVAEVTGKRV
jgi:carbon-monoxide dehydrogenase small subunit